MPQPFGHPFPRPDSLLAETTRLRKAAEKAEKKRLKQEIKRMRNEAEEHRKRMVDRQKNEQRTRRIQELREQEEMQKTIENTSMIIVALVILSICLFFLWRYLKRRRSRSSTRDLVPCQSSLPDQAFSYFAPTSIPTSPGAQSEKGWVDPSRAVAVYEQGPPSFEEMLGSEMPPLYHS